MRGCHVDQGRTKPHILRFSPHTSAHGSADSIANEFADPLPYAVSVRLADIIPDTYANTNANPVPVSISNCSTNASSHTFSYAEAHTVP